MATIDKDEAWLSNGDQDRLFLASGDDEGQQAESADEQDADEDDDEPLADDEEYEDDDEPLADDEEYEDDDEPLADDEEYEDDDEEYEDDDEAFGAVDDEEDPGWWTPYAVLGFLLMLGLLGFFGVFNKAIGSLVGSGDGSDNDVVVDSKAVATATSKTRTAGRVPPRSTSQKKAPQVFGAKHLLVQYKGGRRAGAKITRTKKEALERAAEAARKAKSKKVDFVALVKEYSDEPGAAQRGGDLGRFRKGSMVPAFQAAVERLKVGEVSGTVETPFGFHVILRTL